MVVLVLSSAIFVFLMMYVLPEFGAMYTELSHGKAQLPILTRRRDWHSSCLWRIVAGAAPQRTRIVNLQADKRWYPLLMSA